MPATIALATVKNTYFLNLLHEYTKKEYSEENYLFVYDKSNNQVLYEKYIKVKSPKEVNISSALRNPLDALATTKKWSSMNAGILAARKEIIKVITEDSLPRFLVSPEGKRAAFMLTLKLDGSKATQMAGLLAVYAKPRTPEDKQAAYAGMLKLAPMATLNPALREMGVVPPVPVATKKGDPSKALKLMGVPSKMVPEMTKLIDAYNKAGSQTAKNVALDHMETLAKGIVKRDAIIAGLKSSGLY